MKSALLSMKSRTSNPADPPSMMLGGLCSSLRADFNPAVQQDLIEVRHECLDPHLPLSRYRKHQIIDAPSALDHADSMPFEGFNA